MLPSSFEGELPVLDVRNSGPQEPASYPPIEIRNGRELQAGARSEADFFAEHGFVLLPHITAVEDWENVSPVFAQEVEDIVRNRLFPGRRLEVQQSPAPMRRGRGTNMPQYAGGVHSDGPLFADLFAENIGAFATPQAQAWWNQQYARDDVLGYVQVDFWRTTNMSEPLRHMPLAVCDPNSIDRSDIVPLAMTGIAPGESATNHLSLRFNDSQQWYFYPAMTSDEVLAFKLCEYWKDDVDARPQNVFHTAFADPTAPDDAEQRQSCEHRVGVLILRD